MNQISVESLEEAGLLSLKNNTVQKLLLKYLQVGRINELIKYTHVKNVKSTFDTISSIFDKMRININLSEKEYNNIPKAGPFIVIANHPFGFLDGMAMLKTVCQHHENFKVLANFFLKEIAPLKECFIELNPFESNSIDNVKGLKKAFSHLRNGNPIGIFPAGEVATMQKGFGKIEDKNWDDAVIRFLQKANVPIVPMFFNGNNSLVFHLLGKIHPYLRTLSIPKEFFKKENQTIHVRIGKPIRPEILNEINSVGEVKKYLRTCLYALNSVYDLKKGTYIKKHEPIVEATPANELIREINSLYPENLLLTKSNYEVYLTPADNVPGVINEIGRLRELTFRQVGEGTGRSTDVDKYDKYYSHLFVWDTNTQKIIGAYRVGFGKIIMKHLGKKGFYIQSLFNLGEGFYETLENCIELGRSFVVKEYQQKPLPLFLLWQGILKILNRDSSIKSILGPVSISNDFSRFSKDLMIAFIKKYHFDNELAIHVHPKKEFKVKTDVDSIEVVLDRKKGDLLLLDKFISGIEPGSLKVPVLLKQYIKQNAKIIGFNVDPNFNNCLDGLMILNVNDLPADKLKLLK